VAAALGRRGWQVHTQIGASSFRVDLGVVHPDFAGRYLAGIECDGATYHRSATARDRDKLREQVLRGLGWEIVRIWSTDWWVNPGGTLEHVHARLSGLLDQDRQGRAGEATVQSAVDLGTQSTAESPPTGEAVSDATNTVGPAPRREQTADASGAALPAAEAAVLSARPALPSSVHASSIGATAHFRVSQPAEAVPAGAVSPERFYEPTYDCILKPMVEWVVSHEGPVLDVVLARRIARAHGFQRTGRLIQERVEQIARQRFGTTEEASGTFYWPPGRAAGAEVAFRWPADDESARGVEEICEKELVSLARWVLGLGKTGEDALTAMAREIGLLKLRLASRDRLVVALELARS
jgi:very-short-patch-repair endonuclease